MGNGALHAGELPGDLASSLASEATRSPIGLTLTQYWEERSSARPTDGFGDSNNAGLQ